MDRYLYKKSKNYRKLNYLKRVLGSRKDLEYLYKIEGTSKRDFGYNILLEEMDKMFLDLGKMNLKNWLSICSAPGYYDEYIYDSSKKKAKGTGVTLGVKDGGLEFTRKVPNFTVKYMDIMVQKYKSRTKFEFIITGCLDMNIDKKNRYYNDMLVLSSMLFGLENLKNGGVFALKTSMKNMNLLSNIIYMFNNLFGTVKTFKSTKELTHRSSCYVIGFKYKYGKNRLEDDKNKHLIFLKDLFDAYNAGQHNKISKFSHDLLFNIPQEGKEVERLINNLITTQIKCINRLLN